MELMQMKTRYQLALGSGTVLLGVTAVFLGIILVESGGSSSDLFVFLLLFSPMIIGGALVLLKGFFIRSNWFWIRDQASITKLAEGPVSTISHQEEAPVGIKGLRPEP